jgi:hypothetical protein
VKSSRASPQQQRQDGQLPNLLIRVASEIGEKKQAPCRTKHLSTTGRSAIFEEQVDLGDCEDIGLLAHKVPKQMRRWKGRVHDLGRKPSEVCLALALFGWRRRAIDGRLGARPREALHHGRVECQRFVEGLGENCDAAIDSKKNATGGVHTTNTN